MSEIKRILEAGQAVLDTRREVKAETAVAPIRPIQLLETAGASQVRAIDYTIPGFSDRVVAFEKEERRSSQR